MENKKLLEFINKKIKEINKKKDIAYYSHDSKFIYFVGYIDGLMYLKELIKK